MQLDRPPVLPPKGPYAPLPKDGRAVFFVVEPDRGQLADLAQRLRTGRLRPIVGAVHPLADAPAAFHPTQRTPGRTIIRVADEG